MTGKNPGEVKIREANERDMAILNMATLRKLLLGQLFFNDNKGESESEGEEEEDQEATEEVDPVGEMGAQMGEMVKQMAELK